MPIAQDPNETQTQGKENSSIETLLLAAGSPSAQETKETACPAQYKFGPPLGPNPAATAL